MANKFGYLVMFNTVRGNKAVYPSMTSAKESCRVTYRNHGAITFRSERYDTSILFVGMVIGTISGVELLGY